MSTIDFDESEVYDSDQDIHGLSSEKVQALANSVYAEFKRMMGCYGEESIKELMPLIVTILESLDQSLTKCSNFLVEQEMLKEDNEQLMTRYEMERRMRKEAEQQLMESEDINEGQSREVRLKMENFESENRHLELKCKNYADQIERLQERDVEAKREFSELHVRHNEMIQSYVELIEKTKLQQMNQSLAESPSSPVARPKTEVEKKSSSQLDTHANNSEKMHSGSCETSILTADDSILDDDEPTDHHISKDINLNSLKDELPGTPVENQCISISNSQNDLLENQDKNDEKNENFETLENSDEIINEKSMNNDDNKITKETFVEKDVLAFGDNLHNSENQDTINKSSSIVVKEETANENSLFSELSMQDLGDVDKGADIAGMSKEVENLLSENTKLLATKNALNVVKDDLIQQLDQISTQHTLLKDELAASEKSKSGLEKKMIDYEKSINEMQEEIKNLKKENIIDSTSPCDSSTPNSKNNNDEEGAIPLAQRRRFTRVEMARVLMERNQYKERLMELQEAVRWTETLRAARELNDEKNLHENRSSKKSSIFHFFHRLFQSGNEASSSSLNTSVSSDKSPVKRRSYTQAGGGGGSVVNSISMQYNAFNSRVMPRSKSTNQFYGRSPTIDSLKNEQKLTSRSNNEGRLQACGWSLPNSPTSSQSALPTSTSTSETTSRTKVPVPIYCGPVFDDKPNYKLWCASAVNISDARTKDGGYVMGNKSVFYLTKPADDSSNKTDEDLNNHSKNVDQLDKELKTHQQNLKTESERSQMISSYVWLVASDKHQGGSRVVVKDACHPSKVIQSFVVGSSDTNILCICSVPGVNLEDYKTCLDKEDTKNGADHETGNIKSSKPVQEEKVEKILSPEDNSTNFLKAEKTKSMQPTMWLGAQNGYVYVHSAVNHYQKCLQQIRLRDCILSITHCRGRVLCALQDGTVAIFIRDNEGAWELSYYYLLDLGKPHHSVRCLEVVQDSVWCGYRNKIFVIDPVQIKIKHTLEAHPRRESQVRQMLVIGDGVWVSIRLDSTLRLYHSKTYQHLQDVDVEPYVSKVLGSGKLAFSFVRITSLMVNDYRLWIGTGNGVVMSVPLSEGYKSGSGSSNIFSSTSFSKSSTKTQPGAAVRVYSNDSLDTMATSFIPYCSMANAQLSFHGYKQAVKFFVSVPGCVTHSSESSKNVPPAKAWLVISGGDGYVDFRRQEIGAASISGGIHEVKSGGSQHQPSHIIVWQLT